MRKCEEGWVLVLREKCLMVGWNGNMGWRVWFQLGDKGVAW